MDYDRFYNMDDIIAENLALAGRRIVKQGKKMRGTGVEPVSPKAPDPKSGTLAGSLTNQEASRVTDARSAPPSDARTTTNPTTCAVSSSLRRSESGQ